MPTIDIPHDPTQPKGRWKPRPHQQSFWNDFEGGKRRFMKVWARRHGKDETDIHAMVVAAHLRKGTYWYMLPEAAQVRKAIWEAVDEERQQKRLDMAIPHVIRNRTRDNDMFIEMKCGSTLQCVGADNYHSLVGSPPIGIVLSEYARSDPSALGYLLPILEKNGGWLFVNTTPLGPNHAKRLCDMAMSSDDWHCSIVRADQTDVFDEVALKRIQNEYISLYGQALGQAMYEQEYLCSFEAAIVGAVYGKELATARSEGRITDVPYDSSLPVETWWDLGYRDSTAIWFIQRQGGRLLAIDYYENNLAGIDHYAQELQSRGYVYGRHLVPHDAGKGEVGSGKTLIQQGADLGLKLERQPLAPLLPGINATRPVIARMWFDSQKCQRGIDALTNYRYEWNEARHTLSPTPLHDWASHGADALRTGAMAREHSAIAGGPIRRKVKRI